MDRSKKCLFLSFALLITTSYVYADNSKNGCSEFGVQILNKTNSECLFLNYKMAKGYLISINPNNNIVPPDSSQTFLTQQNLVEGPVIVTDYLCNGRKISIESHQNFCLWQAGEIRGKVISSDPGLTADYLTNNGSYFWSYAGHIYWALENKDKEA